MTFSSTEEVMYCIAKQTKDDQTTDQGFWDTAAAREVEVLMVLHLKSF